MVLRISTFGHAGKGVAVPFLAVFQAFSQIMGVKLMGKEQAEKEIRSKFIGTGVGLKCALKLRPALVGYCVD